MFKQMAKQSSINDPYSDAQIAVTSADPKGQVIRMNIIINSPIKERGYEHLQV